MRTLEGKVALVTGGARRVGAAIARELGAAGAAVAVHYRSSRSDAEALARALGEARTFAADLSDPIACARLIDEVVAWRGRLDVLVNNASVFAPLPFVGGDDDAWERAFRGSLDVNLLAPARLARRAASFLGRTEGVIVNLLDIAVAQSWPTYAHYGAAKAGLAWLTRTLAVALAPRVRSVGIAPGIASFPDDLDAAARARLVARVPLARPGTPEDVARAVRFAVESPYVTGTIIVVDGGRLAGDPGTHLPDC